MILYLLQNNEKTPTQMLMKKKKGNIFVVKWKTFCRKQTLIM